MSKKTAIPADRLMARARELLRRRKDEVAALESMLKNPSLATMLVSLLAENGADLEAPLPDKADFVSIAEGAGLARTHEVADTVASFLRARGSKARVSDIAEYMQEEGLPIERDSLSSALEQDSRFKRGSRGWWSLAK
jgi:hypothetical protein